MMCLLFANGCYAFFHTDVTQIKNTDVTQMTQRLVFVVI
jgi:hypothetical protein